MLHLKIMNVKKFRFPLFWQILTALVVAIIFGIIAPGYVNYVSWMGDLFMRGLKMIIIPLILTSIISGVANIGSADNLGRLGIKTMSYYIITSIIAILTGLFFVNLLKPGVGADLGFKQQVDDLPALTTSFGDLLLNIVPTNIIKAMVENDILALIFFAILFGFFITRIAEKPKSLLTNLANAGFDVMMKMTQFIIWFTPFGIFGIVSKVIAEQTNLADLAIRLGSYFLTVLLGLIVHFGITLPLILRFVAKVNPFAHYKAVGPALLTAFSTSSSSATLSLTIDCVKNKVGVSNKITGFTLPLGATINMDGTALYECVAAMFIAQAYGIEVTFYEQIIVVITALLASIGAAGIPMAGLVMLSVVLHAIGLPLEGIGLIIAVDRILDMFRTTVNVYSDTVGAAVIAKSEGETLAI